MNITVFDTKRKESIVCSKSEAGRIVGVTYKTINEWSKVKETEEYNQFVLIFKTTVRKQDKGKNFKSKSYRII